MWPVQVGIVKLHARLTATHALNGLAATVGTASPRLGSESRWPARSPQELSSLVTNGIRPYSSRHALLCILGWPAKDRLSSFRPRIPACVQYDLRLGPNLLMCVGHLYFLDDQNSEVPPGEGAIYALVGGNEAKDARSADSSSGRPRFLSSVSWLGSKPTCSRDARGATNSDVEVGQPLIRA